MVRNGFAHKRRTHSVDSGANSRPTIGSIGPVPNRSVSLPSVAPGSSRGAQLGQTTRLLSGWLLKECEAGKFSTSAYTNRFLRKFLGKVYSNLALQSGAVPHGQMFPHITETIRRDALSGRAYRNASTHANALYLRLCQRLKVSGATTRCGRRLIVSCSEYSDALPCVTDQVIRLRGTAVGHTIFGVQLRNSSGSGALATLFPVGRGKAVSQTSCGTLKRVGTPVTPDFARSYIVATNDFEYAAPRLTISQMKRELSDESLSSILDQRIRQLRADGRRLVDGPETSGRGHWVDNTVAANRLRIIRSSNNPRRPVEVKPAAVSPARQTADNLVKFENLTSYVLFDPNSPSPNWLRRGVRLDDVTYCEKCGFYTRHTTSQHDARVAARLKQQASRGEGTKPSNSRRGRRPSNRH